MKERPTRYRILTVLVVIISLAVLSAPVAAVVDIDGSATDATLEPDSQDPAEVEFQVTNTGNETGELTVDVNESSLQSNLTLGNVTGDDPNPPGGVVPGVIPDNDEKQVVFSDVDPNETVTVTTTVSKTDTNATINGTQSLTATVDRREIGTVEIMTANITTAEEGQQDQSTEEIVREFAGKDNVVRSGDLFDAFDAFQDGSLPEGDSRPSFVLLEIIDAFQTGEDLSTEEVRRS